MEAAFLLLTDMRRTSARGQMGIVRLRVCVFYLFFSVASFPASNSRVADRIVINAIVRSRSLSIWATELRVYIFGEQLSLTVKPGCSDFAQ